VVTYSDAQNSFAAKQHEEQEPAVEGEAGEEEEEALPGDELLERSEQAASGFKGVRKRPGDMWEAIFGLLHVGMFATPLEAARSRRAFQESGGNCRAGCFQGGGETRPPELRDRVRIEWNGTLFWARVLETTFHGNLNVEYEHDGSYEAGVDMSRIQRVERYVPQGEGYPVEKNAQHGATPGDELLERSEQAASGFKGVRTSGNKWVARVHNAYSGKDVYIGAYNSALEAARARRDFLMKESDDEAEEEAEEEEAEEDADVSYATLLLPQLREECRRRGIKVSQGRYRLTKPVLVQALEESDQAEPRGKSKSRLCHEEDPGEEEGEEGEEEEEEECGADVAPGSAFRDACGDLRYVCFVNDTPLSTLLQYQVLPYMDA